MKPPLKLKGSNRGKQDPMQSGPVDNPKTKPLSNPSVSCWMVMWHSEKGVNRLFSLFC